MAGERGRGELEVVSMASSWLLAAQWTVVGALNPNEAMGWDLIVLKQKFS